MSQFPPLPPQGSPSVPPRIPQQPAPPYPGQMPMPTQGVVTLPYAGPNAPLKPMTPPWRKSVNVFAGVSIAVALLLLTCLAFAGFMIFGDRRVVEKLKEVPAVYNWLVLGSILRILLAMTLIAGAMGLQQLKIWSRPTILAYGIAMLVVQGYDIYITNTSLKLLNDGQQPPAQSIGTMIGYAIWIGHAFWAVVTAENKHLKAALQSPDPKSYQG